MITDEDIYDVYNAFEKVCIEINDIITALDQIMKGRDFIPLNSALRWGTSAVIGNPTYWLPYFSQRLYKKNDNNKIIGFQVLLKDHNSNNKIPFITCAYVQSEGMINSIRDEVYWAGWGNDLNVKLYSSFYLSSYTDGGNVKIMNYFLKLTSIMNIETIQRLIVDPLMQMYGLNLNDVNLQDKIGHIHKLVEQSIITLSDIKEINSSPVSGF